MKQSRLRPDWQVNMADGVRYLETAEGGLERPSVFNHELIYHLTAMAIEHLLAGLYHYHQQLPEDHTLDGMVDGLSTFCPLDRELAEGIKALGRFDDMCPLLPVNKRIPNRTEIKAVLGIGRQVELFAGSKTEVRSPRNILK